MPELITPTVGVHVSFLDAMAEFRAEGRGSSGDGSMVGSDLRQYHETWTDPAVFASYVARVITEADPTSPRPSGYVPCTTLWYVDGDTYLGRLAIRHTLTAGLREFGGHIGYDVRPSARRRGYATAMLRDALPVAYHLGIVSALLTCDTTNDASRRVIESGGGVFADQRGNKLRYWVPTGPGTSTSP